MRKLILLIALCISHQSLFAQGVGINTLTPDPSAALDIQSSNKGLLIPRVSLQSSIDDSTVPSPANALLVFNTNAGMKFGTGFYYNVGTTVSPSWKSIFDIPFPLYGGSSVAKPMLNIENYLSSQSAAALRAYNAGLGTGVHAISGEGDALRVEGKMKIYGNGQAPGAGKVLTSDADGNASWQEALPKVAFRASGIKDCSGCDIIESNKSGTRVAFLNEDYDFSNSYNDVNTAPHNTFNIPVNGIYHFDIKILWKVLAYDDENYQAYIYLVKTVNGVETILDMGSKKSVVSEDFITFSSDFQLKKGDSIHSEIFFTSADAITMELYNGVHLARFNGRLVIKD